jgi:hypothetical protein
MRPLSPIFAQRWPKGAAGNAGSAVTRARNSETQQRRGKLRGSVVTRYPYTCARMCARPLACVHTCGCATSRNHGTTQLARRAAGFVVTRARNRVTPLSFFEREKESGCYASRVTLFRLEPASLRALRALRLALSHVCAPRRAHHVCALACMCVRINPRNTRNARNDAACRRNAVARTRNSSWSFFSEKEEKVIAGQPALCPRQECLPGHPPFGSFQPASPYGAKRSRNRASEWAANSLTLAHGALTHVP